MLTICNLAVGNLAAGNLAVGPEASMLPRVRSVLVSNSSPEAATNSAVQGFYSKDVRRLLHRTALPDSHYSFDFAAALERIAVEVIGSSWLSFATEEPK